MACVWGDSGAREGEGRGSRPDLDFGADELFMSLAHLEDPVAGAEDAGSEAQVGPHNGVAGRGWARARQGAPTCRRR